jgi:fatty acid desaturase
MSLPARTEAPQKRAIDEAIRAIPIEWFKASPAIYWADMLASAAIGWTALALAVTSGGWARVGWLTVAMFGLYHAVLFIHEITHRAQRDVPGFTFVWNVLVGVPLLVPSFVYENVHTDHHRQRSYGTDADPEYLPFGRRSPVVIAVYIVGSLFAPIIFAVRFAILAPLGWLVPPIGRFVADRCSALVINHHYVRHAGIGAAARAQEAGAFVVCWTAAALWWTGVLPASALWCYGIVSAAASGINSARTLAAHRYDNEHDELSMNEQLLDSCTISPSTVQGKVATHAANVFRTLVAPVGLRYHALHHWIPSLPYHNLGRAHRLLVTALTPDAPYGRTIEPGFTPALRDLLQRSTSRTIEKSPAPRS